MPALLCSTLFAAAATAQVPAFEWANAPFGINNPGIWQSYSQGTCVHADKSGNVYASGTYSKKCDFDPGPAYDTSGAFSQNGGGFLVKYDSAGRFQWRRSVLQGSSGSVVSDDSGNVYQSGTFSGTVQFGTGAGAVTRTASAKDMYLAKYSPQGALKWLRTVNGPACGLSCVIGAGALALDKAGNLYQGGEYLSNDTLEFAGVTSGRALLPGSLLKDSYLAKWTTNGDIQWVRQISGNDGEQIAAVAVAPGSGNIIIGGYVTEGLSFPPAATAYTGPGGPDGLVASFSPSGNLNWATRCGTALRDMFTGLCVDKQDNIYAGGYSCRDGLCNTADATVTKLNGSGTQQWMIKIPAAGYSYSRNIAADDSGYIYLTGIFQKDIDFSTGTVKGPVLTSRSSIFDMFLARLNPDGSCRWARSFSGMRAVDPAHIYVDRRANVYTTGTFYDSCDFNPGSTRGHIESNDRLGSWQQGAFFVKYSQRRHGLVGLAQQGVTPEPSISPNPAADRVRISGLGSGLSYEFVLTDILGRQFDAPVYGTSGAVRQLSVAALPPGHYMLSITDLRSRQRYQLRLVKSER